jgi:transcriptional regulator GlxA family with amidase domain
MKFRSVHSNDDGRFLMGWVLVFVCLVAGSSFAADKQIGVLVYDGVLTSDVTAPLEVFGAASSKPWFSDYEVITIGINESTAIETEEGLQIGVDRWVGESPAVEALVLTSSYAMDELLANPSLIAFIKATNSSADLMLSNCSGALLLAESGVLNGRRATTWAGGENEMQATYPEVKVQADVNVVVDGKYVTSNGSLISYEAALIGLAKMSSVENAKEVFDHLQMGRMTSWQRIVELIQE